MIPNTERILTNSKFSDTEFSNECSIAERSVKCSNTEFPVECSNTEQMMLECRANSLIKSEFPNAEFFVESSNTECSDNALMNSLILNA